MVRREYSSGRGCSTEFHINIRLYMWQCGCEFLQRLSHQIRDLGDCEGLLRYHGKFVKIFVTFCPFKGRLSSSLND